MKTSFLQVVSTVLNPLMEGPMGVNYVMHPVSLAALAGVYICGIYLIPAAHLNGGYMMKATTNDIVHRLSTYFFIFLFGILSHAAISFLLLFLYFVKGTPVVLNDITPISRLKKVLFIITIITSALTHSGCLKSR